MATNWPNSVQTFTNPSPGDSLSSPSHADQHTTVNDTVEALQQYAGLVRVFEGSMTGTTYSIDNVFSSRFRCYHVNIANLGESTGGSPTMNIRFRNPSDDTRSIYAYSQYGHYGTTAFNGGFAGQTSMEVATLSSTGLGGASFDIINPNIAAVTTLGGTFVTYQANVVNYTLRTSRGAVASTDAYTGISFIMGVAGSWSGTINIYGYGQA